MLKNKLVVFLPLFLLSACSFFDKKSTDEVVKPTETVLAKVPNFNADSAFNYIEKQVNFGPRTPNSNGHNECAQWMIHSAKQWADTVFVQNYTAVGFDGKQIKSQNIIAAFNPHAVKRIFISAHWDTRPFADQDSKDKDKPIDGANDAGSGVGILLEIARIMKTQPTDLGVDLIFFDSEDYGQPAESELPQKENTYCLGSQYWATHLHTPNYKADFGINLDMVGGKNAVFMREQNSVYNADWATQLVWGIAEKIGYGTMFPTQVGGSITDDHLYVNQLAKIPCIDIIHYDSNGFHPSWHTHQDNLQVIDKTVLNAVGKTVTQVIYEYAKNK